MLRPLLAALGQLAADLLLSLFLEPAIFDDHVADAFGCRIAGINVIKLFPLRCDELLTHERDCGRQIVWPYHHPTPAPTPPPILPPAAGSGHGVRCQTTAAVQGRLSQRLAAVW